MYSVILSDWFRLQSVKANFSKVKLGAFHCTVKPHTNYKHQPFFTHSASALKLLAGKNAQKIFQNFGAKFSGTFLRYRLSESNLAYYYIWRDNLFSMPLIFAVLVTWMIKNKLYWNFFRIFYWILFRIFYFHKLSCDSERLSPALSNLQQRPTLFRFLISKC